MILGLAIYLIVGLGFAEFVHAETRKTQPEDAWIAWLLCLTVWPVILAIALLDKILSFREHS